MPSRSVFSAPQPVFMTAVALALGCLGAGAAAPARKAPERTGEQVYRQVCAGCHGAKGEGGVGHPEPLFGSLAVPELAQFIARSMPPGAKKKLPADEARRAAQFIYDSFYSPVAQARNRPARVELSRLTVRQYRNVVTDLIGSFRAPARTDERRGLHAEYFRSRRFGRGERLIERVDPQINFDWGTGTPEPGEFDAHQFTIRWDGAVIAPETGEYEFTVKTGFAARLWINDLREPLVDAWVRSGSDNAFGGSIYLLGGRSYPLRLEFSKANQGVDDTNKLAGRPIARASLVLEWKPPKRAAEPIPERCLAPSVPPALYLVKTPFPPDDRSMGYERGTLISKAWDEATTDAALEASRYVVGNLRELSGVADTAPDRVERLRAFCRAFAERAFRRPLTPDQVQTIVDRQFAGASDPEAGVRRSTLLVLKSPRFLFRELAGNQGDAHDIASRLAFGLWDSLPDPTLLEAAAAGELSTREQITQHAVRMLGDPRAHSKLREFFLQWLKVDHYPELAKNPKLFPGFDDGTASDLRTSLELFLDDVLWSEKSDYRELMLSDHVYLNGRLGSLYGVRIPPSAPFQKVALESSERAGILTHPYLMSSFAYLESSSPIHRGVMLARNVLGRLLMPPPIAVAPVSLDLQPNLTTRQRVTLQTQPETCMKCHGMINSLGFALERFDAIGRFRTVENNRPIDATGSYSPRSGPRAAFAGARDLGRYLVGSDDARTAFAEKLFQYLVKQPVRGYGPEALAGLVKCFSDSGLSMRRQAVESVVLAALGGSGRPLEATARGTR